MSNPHPYLPPEILDQIVDLLHDNQETLLRCCLVSKSWAPRTRKHLFAHVEFKAEDYERWMKTFPDPINSPAYHVHTLTVDGSLRGAQDSSWIQGFTRVERLIVDREWTGSSVAPISLLPFHRLASSLKALYVSLLFLPHTKIFDLVRSLTLLEDLTLNGEDADIDGDESVERQTIVSSTPLALTGTLELFLYARVGRTLRRLVDLPGGVHFRKIDLSWCGVQDLPQVVEMVAACSDTLESIEIACKVDDEDTPIPIDLSKATKLREVAFRCGSMTNGCGWIITALNTITSEHRDLKQISVQVPYPSDEGHRRRSIIERAEAEGRGRRWSDLDSLLVGFWESRSVSSKIVCPWTRDRTRAKDWAVYLLPETTKRGIIVHPFDEFNDSW